MTPLKRRIVELIEADGPIGIAQYMAICLFDPADGYYTTREPFGADGDFTTAPEISQMFGELVGVWIHLAWQAIGRPDRVTLAEIGPGRGTMMADMMRTLERLSPDFHRQATIALIETSPRLVAVQRRTLGKQRKPAHWHESIGTLPRGPLIILGNELFDAVPVRQYVRTGSGWRERCVSVDEDGALCFVAGSGTVEASLLPSDAEAAAQSAIVELAPARNSLMQEIAGRIGRDGGAGLFLDYGYTTPAVGDTLQALLKHRFDDPLAHPGLADLTAHVDFTALAGEARRAGLEASLLPQGDFLVGLGLLQRAGRLGADADEAGRQAIRDAVDRLAGPDRMGALFKALAVTPRGVFVPPFARTDTISG